MRIISGEYGGRTLKSPPPNAQFRPTTDRVRESLFNILAHSAGFEGKRILDLFAGTGALALEALSRGAESAVLVESSRRHAIIIEENIAELGLEKRTKVTVMTVESFLKSASGTYDIIFCDPPYTFAHVDSVMETIGSGGLLNEGGIFCLEHSGKATISPPNGWQISHAKHYGTTGITLMENITLTEGPI